jgi:predicted MFS family arabinose efflux permease
MQANHFQELKPDSEREKILPKGVVWLMAVSVGVIVANIYYSQPLLAAMAATFNLTAAGAGTIALLSQIGTAAGMLIFVPLGDSHERRGLITWMVLAAAVSLGCMAAAPNAVWLCAATMAMGAASSAVHVIVPYAAELAPVTQRGRVVGTVLSGLLMGILLARTFSGLLGARFGWRAVYWVGAVAMLGMAVLIRSRLPPSTPHVELTWIGLLKSAGNLVRKHPELRESALLGSAFFCVFSAFWTTLVFFLKTPPYHYGEAVAGIFGLVGAAGAAGAPVSGRLTDRRGPRFTILISLLTAIAAYVVLGVAGKRLAGLICGVLLLDLGVQAGHVANQTRIYGLDPGARGRLNMVYMVCYFVGGALGSSLGAEAWKIAGWGGVCGFSLAVLGIATGFCLSKSRREAVYD